MCKVLVLETGGGGPNRNVTHVSAKAVLLAYAKLLDLDCLIAHRTTPGQSYINPVERLMSLLNLGLCGGGGRLWWPLGLSDGVARERGHSDDGTEAVLKNSGSMAARRTALRDAGAADPNKTHTKAFCESMKVPIDVVGEAMQQMKWHDCHVNVMNPETTAEMDELLAALKEIQPTFDLFSDAQAGALQKISSTSRHS